MLIEILLIFLLFLFLFYFYFHREPKTNIAYNEIEEGSILSPAYGKIYGIYEEENKVHIVIILDLFDIHVQYYPMNGTVTNQVHDMIGKYSLVFDLFKSKDNEKIITTINTNHGEIVVQQIAGILVRNITTTLRDIPEEVKMGDKLGHIKYGSRVDLILPKDNLEIFVSQGQEVLGPNTIIGQYK